MNWMNWIGAAVCVLIFIGCFFVGEAGTVTVYFNVVSLLVVLSGTFGAVFLGHSVEKIRNAFRVARNVHASEAIASPEKVVDLLLDLAVRSKHDGLVSLEKYENQITVSFLKDGLTLLVDGYSEDEIRDILHTEMQQFKMRRNHSERIFRTMAAVAPPFGVAGSIIGLIGMLVGIGEAGIILRTIPLALTATLYSIVLSYLVFTPIAESIHSKTQSELFLQNLITEGVIEIRREQNVYRLEKKLKAFLTPSARAQQGQTIRDIQKRYLAMKKTGHQPAP